MPSWALLNSTLILSSSTFFIRRPTHSSFRFLFSSVNRNTLNPHESEQFLLQCLSQKRLREARNLLEQMPRGSAYYSNKGGGAVVMWTSMLSKFARHGFVDEARILFELLPERNVVTYNAMLSGYVHSGRVFEACKLFDEMPERNVVSWTCMLGGLTHAGRMEEAKELFNCMPERNVVSWNSMIVGLIRNGDLVEAGRVFDLMPGRNQISWNTMIAGYAENCMMEEARGLFEAVPDANVITWTSLVAGYCRAGDVEEGYRMFQRMPSKNVVSWTAMIGGFVWNGFYDEALLLFLEMRRVYSIRPNEETFLSLVYACSGLGYSCLGKQLHTQMILNNLCDNDYDRRLDKSLIHMYSEFGMMDFAGYIYNENNNNHVVQSCNSMISGYIRIGLLEKARDLFETMPSRDKISWTSMIAGYFSAGNVEEACWFFERMPERDNVSWTVMISGHIQNELFTKAMNYFLKMQMNRVKPLDATYSTLLGAAGAVANLSQGKKFHCQLMKTQQKLDIILENSLVSMYAKCGELDEARHVFSNMISRDTISWNSMIVGLSHHGLVKEAIELFNAMQDEGIHPNSVTFLGLLSGCSHTGMVDQGWELFNSMNEKYAVQQGLEHYICMVDLLGRAGKVEEAERFVMNLPFDPGLTIWGALLGVCGLGKVNTDTAIHASQRVLELDPTNAPAHVLLCNIYAANGQRDQELLLRKRMGFKGVKKVPGCSWVTLNGSIHMFLSGEKLQPQADVTLSLLCWECCRYLFQLQTNKFLMRFTSSCPCKLRTFTEVRNQFTFLDLIVIQIEIFSKKGRKVC